MRYVALIALLVITVSGCASKKNQPTQKEIATKQWNAARADVLHSLARDQYRTGNFDKCRKTLDEALKLNPESGKLHALSAKLLIEQGQLESAERQLALARELEPNEAETEYLSGIIYQRWQRMELALQHYEKASEKAPEELAYVLARAETLVMLDRHEQALALLKEKMAQFEYSAIIRDAAGQILMQMGRFDRAVDLLRHAVMLADDEPTIKEHLALALYYNRDYREAADLLTRLVALERFSNRADLYVALAESQIQIGRMVDARRSFETASQLNPASATVWLGLAKTALQLGDIKRAELSLKKAISIDAANAEAHLLFGYLHLRHQRMREALTSFQKASALSPSDPVAICMIGYVLEKMGETEQAIQQYARALQLKPGDELASRLMASVDRD
jgi:Flp pilus assembly protein TadD